MDFLGDLRGLSGKKEWMVSLCDLCDLRGKESGLSFTAEPAEHAEKINGHYLCDLRGLSGKKEWMVSLCDLCDLRGESSERSWVLGNG